MTRHRRASALPAPPLRPPGWFTEPVRAWFGPFWRPQTDWGDDAVTLSERARAGRETQAARGESGGVVGLSRRNDARLAVLGELRSDAPPRRTGARHLGPRQRGGAMT